jgi:hypothetical protein
MKAHGPLLTSEDMRAASTSVGWLSLTSIYGPLSKMVKMGEVVKLKRGYALTGQRVPSHDLPARPKDEKGRFAPLVPLVPLVPESTHEPFYVAETKPVAPVAPEIKEPETKPIEVVSNADYLKFDYFIWEHVKAHVYLSKEVLQGLVGFSKWLKDRMK